MVRCLWVLALVGVGACSDASTEAPPVAATLVDIVAEPAGSHCTAGGFAIRTGRDIDGDGVLAQSEIQNVDYRCHPIASTPMPHIAVRQRPEQPGPHCDRGGTVVESGIDDNTNGVLDDDEVDDTLYVCDPVDAPPRLLSRVETLAAGAACPSGGTAVYSGRDVDGDGSLADAEIETTQTVCDDATSSPEVEVAAGTDFSCARKANGTVWCWGSNRSHQVGLPGDNDAPGPVPVVGVFNATSIVAGARHACALDADGAIWCWGDNGSDELGHHGGVNTASVVPGVPAFVALTAGSAHTCGLTMAGAVWCWGFNYTGQLGHSAFVASPPAEVAGISDVAAIAAGSSHTCALARDGRVWCWGAQLGGAVDDETCNGYECHVHPTLMERLPTAIAIASGNGSACIVTAERDALCWGSNYQGKLGDGTDVSRSDPAPVVGLADVSEIALGGSHSCAVRGDGSLWCWGSNAFGQLAQGTVGAPFWLPQSAPGQFGLSGLSLGTYHACAVRDGAAHCWGYNSEGQVSSKGVPRPVEIIADAHSMSAGDFAACVVVRDGSVWCWGALNYSQFYGIWDLIPVRKTGLPPAAAVAVGTTHACILALDSSVWCWGGNSYGELGKPYAPSTMTPVKVDEVPDAVEIYAGGAQSCAKRADGSLWCWGTNGVLFGQGVAPRQILTTVRHVALGAYHGCAVDTLSQAWCWGANNYYQVTSGGHPAPVTKVASDAAMVAAGYDDSCVVGLDGGTACWGNYVSAHKPVALGDIAQIEFGFSHRCMLRPDATMACAGFNSHGQLGDGTFDYHVAPVAVVGLDDVAEISAGYEQTCAMRRDGSVWCWGANDAGQIGNGGVPELVTSPVIVEL